MTREIAEHTPVNIHGNIIAISKANQAPSLGWVIFLPLFSMVRTLVFSCQYVLYLFFQILKKIISHIMIYNLTLINSMQIEYFIFWGANN